MLDVRAIDTVAVSRSSALHRAAPATKLLAFALVLSAAVLQMNVLVLAAVALVLAAVAVGSRLPLRLVLPLAAYPAVFAAVFAVAAAPDALTGTLFVVKAVTAALAAVTLVCTTPYPQVFAPLQAIVPGLVGDALLMTYRSLFILAEKMTDLLRAVRLRSGLTRGHPVRAARATASALGGLILYALDLAQREYDVMTLRGYRGRLRVELPRAADRTFDARVIAGAATVLAVAILWRIRPAVLGPYSWLPTLAALVALAGAALWRWTHR